MTRQPARYTEQFESDDGSEILAWPRSICHDPISLTRLRGVEGDDARIIPTAVLTAGDILGDCEILSPLGRGGMGEVYLARDRRLGRKVAVKVLPASLSSDATRLARFEREARSASALNHPNICTIHAFGELADGRRFIVMEHVDGATLRALHREPLDLARTVRIGRQLGEGLAAAHDAGVVHRDVKPENVMVRADGLVKILDFGLAKLLPESAMAAGESTQSVEASLAGSVVGTVQYMSPEQARGQPTDARTDVWAVGAVLYELVTGHPPFDGRTTSDIVANVLHVEPPPLERFAHDCPPELQRIVSKCLRKDRGHRYQTMRDVALDLEALGDTLRGGSTWPSVPGGEPATRQSEPAPGPSSPSTSTHPSRRWLGVAGVLVALAVGGIAWWMGRARSTETTRPGGTRQLALKRLTFGDGLQTDVSFSPDGRFIAYASDQSGNFDIWVQPVDGGDAVQITKEPAHDLQPAWSPDGDSIAFRSERSGGGIFVMPALGGHARQLSTFGSHPSWLGRSEILFLLGNPESAGVRGQLFVVPVNGDAPREVLHDFLLGRGVFWAAGHPDGRISVFTGGLFTLSRDGKSVTASHIPVSFPIHRGVSLDNRPTRFHWNRSGTALYVEATVDGIQNLWRVAVDTRSLEWLSMERLTTGPGRDVAASLSGDGRRLAYTTTSEQTRVFVQSLSADGRTLTGSPQAVTESGAEVFTSALSNDGRRLAYVIRRAGSARFEIRIAHLDTGANVLLDEDIPGSVHMVWSPDDSAILHQRVRQVEGRPTHEAQLVRHEPGSRETVLLPWNSRAFLGTEVAPGPHELLGQVFYFSGAPSQIAIWSMVGDASLKKHRVLFSDPKASLWEPAYVPGGRWMTFVREPAGEAQRLELMIAPAEGSPSTAWIRLVADHQSPDKPRWSADGRLLYFLSRGSGDYVNLWALPFDPIRGVPTGTAFAITSYDSPARFVSPHAGRIGMNVVKGRVALTMSSTTGSIWMLDDLESGEARTGSR
jgi:eukaryotic-like serine/threonine-protein kinase